MELLQWIIIAGLTLGLVLVKRRPGPVGPMGAMGMMGAPGRCESPCCQRMR